MPRFSLGQILVGVVPLAIGFSIWRLPKGSWIDIPVAILSFYFATSLSKHAYAMRQRLIVLPLEKCQRWGCRLLLFELLGTALALTVAWTFRYLAAAELVLTNPNEGFINFVDYATLPRDLALLAMLVAICLSFPQTVVEQGASPWRRVSGVLAAGGTITALGAYWADRMLIWFLVYIAMAGAESSRPPQFVPAEMNVSIAMRVHRFELASFGGLACLFAVFLLIGGLVIWWDRPRWRRTLLIFLAAILAGQSWLAGWIALRGIPQLSLPMHEVLKLPRWPDIIIVTSMILLAAGASSWRMFGQRAPATSVPMFSERFSYFHINWKGCVLLGIVALAVTVNTAIAKIGPYLNGTYTSGRVIVEGLSDSPEQLISLAAAIGGISWGWLGWRRRNEASQDYLPCVNPAQFVVTVVAIVIAVVTAAPIVAAASFSYWFVQ